MKKEKENLLHFIERRKKELGIKSDQGVCKAAGCYHDTIRNLRRSLKKNPNATFRGDNYEKMISFLSQDTKQEPDISDPIREDLDTAIKLWFRDRYSDRSPIRTLVLSAYRKLYPNEKDKDLSNKPIEGFIYTSIVKIQLTRILLNKIEIAFILWIFLEYPSLFKGDSREFFNKIMPIGDFSKNGETSKIDFFKKITGNGREQEDIL